MAIDKLVFIDESSIDTGMTVDTVIINLHKVADGLLHRLLDSDKGLRDCLFRHWQFHFFY
jgi:hypothetical protein